MSQGNYPIELDALAISGLRAGKYSLLFGAGGSLGAKGPNGLPLPDGAVLADVLTGELGLDIKPGTPLSYVWEAALHKIDGDEADLRAKILVPRLTECIPAPYHWIIPTFAWQRIFTFNIDDVLFRTYSQAKQALQSPRCFHFDEDYADADTSNDELPIVYLHGGLIFPDRPLVFSPQDYAAATIRQHPWWHVFASLFREEPFIVIGATLREPDLEAYLSYRDRIPKPAQLPSFYVAPDIDDAVLGPCRRPGLTPIKATGAELLERISQVVGAREKPSARAARTARATSILTTVKSTPALASVARQFLVVNHREEWPAAEHPPEAFYEGYEPDWSDVARDLDVPREFADSIATSIIKSLQPVGEVGAPTPSTPRLVLLEGTAGSGKTTCLMRISAELAKTGTLVFYFTAADRFRDEALREVAGSSSSKESMIIVVDHLAEHVNQVHRFIEEYPKNGPRCVILAAERTAWRQHIIRHLQDVVRFEDNVHSVPPLTQKEGIVLAQRLRAAAKLGQFAGRTDADLAAQFVSARGKEWAGQLLVILLEIVPGSRLQGRLVSEWQALSGADQDFYGLASMATACGVPLRSALLFSCLKGVRAKQIMASLQDGPLRGLLTWTGDGWRPRHRVVAEETVRRAMTPDQIFDLSARICGALAPFVSRKTIKSRAPEVQIVRQIMDSDGLVIPRLGNRAEQWFASVEVHFGWNSRYWEQRALLAMREGNLSRARDYGEQAVGHEPDHPLPMTTCARIWLESSENDEALSLTDRQEYWARAVTLLDEARTESIRKHFEEIHPYHILLQHAVRAGGRLWQRLPDDALEVIRRFAREAQSLFPRDPDIQKVIQRLRTERII